MKSRYPVLVVETDFGIFHFKWLNFSISTGITEILKYQTDNFKQAIQFMSYWLKRSQKFKENEDHVLEQINIIHGLKEQLKEIETLPTGIDQSEMTLTNEQIKQAFENTEERTKPRLISWKSFSCYVVKININNKDYALKIPRENKENILRCFENEEYVYRRIKFL